MPGAGAGSSKLVYRELRLNTVAQHKVQPINELALIRSSLPSAVASVDSATQTERGTAWPRRRRRRLPHRRTQSSPPSTFRSALASRSHGSSRRARAPCPRHGTQAPWSTCAPTPAGGAATTSPTTAFPMSGSFTTSHWTISGGDAWTAGRPYLAWRLRSLSCRRRRARSPPRRCRDR